MRLVPRNPDLGWTPYAWLIYLGFFLIDPLEGRGGTAAWAATALVIAVFLPLYFWGYWQSGRRRLLRGIAGIAALGALSVPWNHGASVFYIYAGAFCGQLVPARFALSAIAAVLALFGVEAWALGLPVYSWIPAVVFTPLIGGINLYYAELGRQRARLRETQERMAQVAERERIARDLHDLLGHSLSLVTLKAELAGKLLGREPERAAAEVRDIERISREALREVRSAVAGYRSAGIEGELARARLALEAAGIRCELLMAPVALDRAQETVLSLALREAVTNVVRHAGATSCRLGLEPAGGGGARLEVEDDGRGGLAPEGVGLSAMRERVEGLGGRVERHGERGTRLVVTLPRREPEAAGREAPELAGAGAANAPARPGAAERSASAAR
jgi:two-component system sensor histidine kinase DesK